MTPGHSIATRTFSLADQEAFAGLSGDRNPIHLDQIISRRTIAGAPVVHGLHGVLWALEELRRSDVELTDVAKLKVQFPQFMYLDHHVSLHISRHTDEALKAELTTDAGMSTSLNLTFGQAHLKGAPLSQHAPSTENIETPRELALTQMQGLSGCLTSVDIDEIQRRFPALCAAIGEKRVASLALMSTLVGMACPGLHSIFAGFEVTFLADSAAKPYLSWETVRTDERFRKVVMNVRGLGFEGEVQAFARPEPVEPPRMADLATLVSAHEFAERTALIVGGTRGLGAVTAKLLAAGGARIFATYASGRCEADALVADVLAAGGNATALHCDVTGNVSEQFGNTLVEVTHVYYFATPRIGQGKAKVFARERFDAFLSFYVDGFLKVTSALASQPANRLRSAFYPSTIFLDDRPKGMTEYAMAKAAGEILAKDLAGTLGIQITAPRIPRLLTDQTVGLTPVGLADSTEVMLSLLRAEDLSPVSRHKS